MSGSFLWRVVAAGLVTLAIVTPAQAKKPFGVQVTAPDATGSPTTSDAGFSSVSDAVDYLDPDSLRALYPTIDTAAVLVAVDFRGLPQGMLLTFANNDGLLDFQVPLFNFSRTFGRACLPAVPGNCADVRRDGLRELQDFLQSNPQFLKRLLTAMARFSPIDPLAGNPDSLFSRSMRADFQQGFTHKVSQIWGCNTTAFNGSFGAPIMVAAVGGVADIFADAQERAARLQAQNEIGFGVMYSATSAESGADEYATTGITVPLSYTVKFDSDPRKKLRFDLPLGYTDTEGAVSYALGVGLAYTHPLSDVWTLTPAIGAGATGSDDLGAAGGVSSYSLTSAYTWRLGGFALSMGNAVGKYDALALKIGDVEAEADISNTVFTNGLLLTGPNSLIARNLIMEYSITDTRITGDEVYADSYDEFGVALGYINTTMGVIDSYSKVGLSYLVGSGDLGDISSLRLNLSVRF
ncbi:MAG: hypothetical protein ACRETF_02325 [Nevskiaceae bacterium]